MASKRAVQLLALRAPHAGATRTAAARFTARCAAPRRVVVGDVVRAPVGLAQKRWHSAFPSDRRSKEYQFEDILTLLETPTSPTLLIDVREPSEYATNTIPLAINIPVSSQPDALLLSPEDFQDRFGFQKPPLEHELVFFCKAGVRSRAAAQLAKQAGYQNVGEYRGSWLDWERRGGPSVKDPPAPGGRGEPSGAVVREEDSQGNSVTVGDRTDAGADRKGVL